jgi:hypothetical protein
VLAEIVTCRGVYTIKADIGYQAAFRAVPLRVCDLAGEFGRAERPGGKIEELAKAVGLALASGPSDGG